MSSQDGEFGFGHVEPASVFGRVVPFESIGEAESFVGREGLVERRAGVRVEIVLHQYDLGPVGKHGVGDVLEDLGVIDGRMTVVTSTRRMPSSGANIMNRLATPLRSYS